MQEEEIRDIFLINSKTQRQILFICFKARIADKHRQRFIETYKIDPSYNKIIQDLRPPSTKKIEEILNTTKFGHLF